MRCVLALSIVGLIAAGGCRMCASPYDYCSPVVECDDSIHPAAYTMPPASVTPETVPAPQAKPEAPTPSPAPQSEMPQASRTRSSMRQARRRPPYLRNDQNSDTVVPQSGQVYER